MKQDEKSGYGQVYSDVKITVSAEFEEKLKNVKPSALKLEKARKAAKTLDLDKIRSMHFAK